MYEKPKLNRVGDAQDVILGFVAAGTDLDGTFAPGPPIGGIVDDDDYDAAIPNA